MRQCQCETPIVDWDAPDCDGTCRRCAGDLSQTLTTSPEGGPHMDADYIIEETRRLRAGEPQGAWRDGPEGGNAMKYVVVENTPGYLPDDMEPATFDLFYEAVAYMDELVKSYREGIEGGGILTREVSMMRSVASAYVSDPSREHDLGRVFEIVVSEDA